MVDELTQESFQTGKAIVTVSVDLITAIADACKRSEQQNPGMSEEQKETLLGKVVDKVMSNYKETHGSLKGFNREGKNNIEKFDEDFMFELTDEELEDLQYKNCTATVYAANKEQGNIKSIPKIKVHYPRSYIGQNRKTIRLSGTDNKVNVYNPKGLPHLPVASDSNSVIENYTNQIADAFNRYIQKIEAVSNNCDC